MPAAARASRSNVGQLMLLRNRKALFQHLLQIHFSSLEHSCTCSTFHHSTWYNVKSFEPIAHPLRMSLKRRACARG